MKHPFLIFFYKLLISDILLKKHEWNGLGMHKITVGPFVYCRRSLVFSKLRDIEKWVPMFGFVSQALGTYMVLCTFQ